MLSKEDVIFRVILAFMTITLFVVGVYYYKYIDHYRGHQILGCSGALFGLLVVVVIWEKPKRL